VAAVEPLDITQLLSRAAPSLENLQKILTNLEGITETMKKPEGDLAKIMVNFRDISDKLNQGKGSLGLLINDPALYREATQTVMASKKILTDFNQSVFWTFVKSPQFTQQAKETVVHFRSTMAQTNEAAGHLKQGAAQLPGILQKLDSFLTNLDKAGKGLPGLVTEGETMVSDADHAAKAAQKSWLLRKNIPKPKEHTIRLDADPGRK
jgi:phospholipid/cholesterol/gamma-HCH transport system substrate-binding protein